MLIAPFAAPQDVEFTRIFWRGGKPSRQRLFTLLLSAMGLFLLGGCQRGSEGSTEQVLHRGQPGEPRTLDPQLVDDDFSFPVVRDLYEGLTAEDLHGAIVPGVSDAWLMDQSKTTYTFHIRSTAKWSDGESIVAQEFVDGLRRAVDPATASGSAGLLAVIKNANDVISGEKPVQALGVTAIGSSNVRIELEHPAPYFLQILSQPIAAPFRAKTKNNIGLFNGAYVLARRVSGSFIELVRNPYYWNAKNVAVKSVSYVNAESEETELQEYLSGQIDLTYTIPLTELARVKQEHESEVRLTPSLGVSYLALNVQSGPLESSTELREALCIAIDRDRIARYLLGGASPAFSFIPGSLRNYDPPRYEWAAWSREKQLAYAKALYAKAGYSEAQPLHLRLYYSNNDTIRRTMIAIAANWREYLGVESELISEEFRVFLAGRKDRSRWDVLRLRWQADFDDPSSFLEIFVTTSNQNDSGYSNPSFDQLLAQARVEKDASRRSILYRSAEKLLLESYPVIPIYFPIARHLVSSKIAGAEVLPMDRIYSKNLSWRSD